MGRMIGTHNSATGETPLELVSWAGQPVARCQSKDIGGQLEAGVRLFDLRVKPYRNKGSYNLSYPLAKIQDCHLGHGLCDYRLTLGEALTDIEDFMKLDGKDREKAYVLITLEGRADGKEERFLRDVQVLASLFSRIVLLEVNVKLPTWTQLYRNGSSKVTYTKDYPLIKGWRALLPFPRFWHLFRSYGLLSGVTSFSLRDFV